MFSNGLRLEKSAAGNPGRDGRLWEPENAPSELPFPRGGGGPGLRALSCEILGPRFRGGTVQFAAVT